MAAFWMTEVIPLAVTAVIPVFAFPLLGILSTDDVCLVYMKETNMMFLGGLAVAIAIEHCNLHQRIALLVILRVGQSPRRLMTGFMLTTMFLSMWISNTASTAMMVPVVEAIIVELQLSHRGEDSGVPSEAFSSGDVQREQVEMESNRISSDISNTSTEKFSGGVTNDAFVREETNGGENTDTTPGRDQNTRQGQGASSTLLDAKHLALRDMCLMATAYSANIGGTGSLTGTGPNMVVKSVLESSFSEPSGLNFATWMAFNIPGMILCVILAWVWLQILYMGLGCKTGTVQKTSAESEAAVKHLISRKYRDLGPMTHQEKTVTLLFVALVVLWFFEKPEFIPGWATWISSFFEKKVKIGGATPALAVTFLLFVLPAQPTFWCSGGLKCSGPMKASPACIAWEVIHQKMPWNLMFLLGGGFALAKGSSTSGLSSWLGSQLVALQVMPKEAIVFIVSLMTAMATEVASNTATASIILPVLKEMALNMKVNPLYLMLPAAVCCSYAFMLPVATPPNAIVFNAAQMSNFDMMKAGVVMNIICVIVITVMINSIGIPMFDLHSMPAWTNSTTV
ncbi:solute carrier family 13 member 2-like [Macrobrachium nipponense]|uniref:solute carrier family 13 member 2-like n=1 Tax=Macrobrachium nipponense TaxID=159736 RepID=UPI0030C7EDF2